MRRNRSGLAAAAAVAALAMTATACGPEDTGASDKPSDAASQSDSGSGSREDLKDALDLPDLPENIPDALKDLEKWKNGAWKDWDKEDWLREAEEFINPIIEDFWNPDRMEDAEENDRDVDESEIDEGVTDPEPKPVQAKEIPTPYTKKAPPVGKVFMETPKGTMVCSGTVIKNPKKPGKSNLVATAGHCVHAGKEGGWFRNVAFVPHYNPNALTGAEMENATQKEVAPHGVWWAKHARTTDYWIENGAPVGGKAAPKDFAVLKVQPEDKSGKSLQETVGGAASVNFDTPVVKSIENLTAFGYPAAPPYNGLKMYKCKDQPGRLTIDKSQPTMYRIGCTMTGGSSGGGWLTPDGKTLLSVTSIGPVDHTWLAGPRLGKAAEGVFKDIVKLG